MDLCRHNIIVLLMLIIACRATYASDTSLLFVGEDVSLVTIASRRAEKPEHAPAVTQVIGRKEIERNGFVTLAEVLNHQPGFHMSYQPSGTVPFLRGMSDSVLFLYDSVHLTSDATRAITPVDLELSLDNIRRIEVIRGPGSVLWGPDASAGIVNVVPKRGRDLNGLQLKAYGGAASREVRGYIGWGKNAGLWEAYISLSAASDKPYETDYNIIKLTGPDGKPVPPEQRSGSDSVGRSTYTEAIFNFTWQDWLRLSGRWSEADREYVLSDRDAGLSWPATAKKPVWYMRLEIEKKFTSSVLKLNAYYNQLDEKIRDIDLEPLNQKSHITYGELLYDRKVFGADGMLTLGVSYRHNSINGAEITKAYPADFFDTDSSLFLPRMHRKDFSTSMISGFGQFKYHWKHFDAWCGLRITDHDEYDINLSPNVGVIWSPSSAWNLKLLYGTSYLTPYARQLVGRDDLEQEKIQNISASLTWNASHTSKIKATAFWDHMQKQVTEDPYYGGLSDPTTQDVYGAELQWWWHINSMFSLQSNATTFAHNGDKEHYTYYTLVLDDGQWVPKPWISWDTPFETGPRTMVNASLVFTPSDYMTISINGKYEASWHYTYNKGQDRGNIPASLILDAALTVKNFPLRGVKLQLAAKNLLDSRNETRGEYGPIERRPVNVYFIIQTDF